MVGVVKNCLPLIKEALYHHPGISRTQLAELLGVKAPSIGPYVSELLEQGAIRESKDDDRKGAGRKQVHLTLVATLAYAIGIELGPYGTYLCISDMTGTMVFSSIYERAPIGYDDLVAFIRQTADDGIQKSGIPREKILGVSVGIPGYVDKGTGTIFLVPDRKDWSNRTLGADLNAIMEIPVTIQNNTRARAIAADLFLTTPEESYFAYLLVSRGIACPVIVEGKDISMRTAGAGEIGLTVVNHTAFLEEDAEENHGRLIDESSEMAILRKARSIMDAYPDCMLHDLVPDKDSLELPHIMLAMEKEDPYVLDMMKNAIMYLGLAVGNIINVINPQKIYIDAYIMKSERNRELLRYYIRKSIRRLSEAKISLEFLDFTPFRGAMGGCADVLKTFFIKKD